MLLQLTGDSPLAGACIFCLDMVDLLCTLLRETLGLNSLLLSLAFSMVCFYIARVCVCVNSAAGVPFSWPLFMQSCFK